TGDAAAVATTLAYPVADVTLVALVIAGVVLTGGRPLRTWLLLGVGFLVFAVGDSFYVSVATTGGYSPGYLVDALWPAGLLLMAGAAWQSPGVDLAVAPRGLRRLVLAVPSAAVALVLLVLGPVHAGRVGVVLAAATLL